MNTETNRGEERIGFFEEFLLTLVRVLSLPFLLVGLVLWALIVGIAYAVRGATAVAAGCRNRGRSRRGLSIGIGAHDV